MGSVYLFKGLTTSSGLIDAKNLICLHKFGWNREEKRKGRRDRVIKEKRGTAIDRGRNVWFICLTAYQILMGELMLKIDSFEKFLLLSEQYCQCHHHHHIALVARISLTLSRHSSPSFIALGRSSGQHPVSSHSC